MITSRQNPRIKEWMQLAKHSKNSRVLVEGAHLLAEAIVSRVEIEVVLYVPRRVNDEVQSLVSQVQQRGVEVVEMSEDCFKKISLLSSSEKVALVYKAQQEQLTSFLTGNKRIVILENVQDPGNAGAVVRVAEATGMDGCLFIGGVSVNNGKFMRATMGAAFRLPCLSAEESDFFEAVKSNPIKLLATELNDQATSFMKVDYSVAESGVGICFGSEGKGISAKLLDFAEKAIYIPMAGKVESLNIAVAAGIVLYHVWQSERC